MSNSSLRARHANLARRSGLRRGLIATVGVLTLGLAAACGGASSDTENNSGVQGEAPEVAQNQTLTVGVATLQQQYADPVLANEGGNTYPIKWSVGEPLVRQDMDLSQVPALATEWSVSDDGLTWTVDLREGVKMHDGSDFTARDVETAIKRVQENDDITSYAAYASKIDKVTVVDDHQIEITTNVPYANLVFDTPAPVATDYYNEVGEEEFRKAPIAAGPWKFDSQKFNDSMTLTRFEDFWDEERVANFETLVLKIIPDESSRISGLQTGQIDVAQGLSPNGAAQLQGSGDIKLVQSSQASVAGIYFMDNYFPDKDSKLKDPQVREALLMAVDRQSIADSLYKGFGTVPSNMTQPVTLGHDESLEPVPYDPEKAKQMLADAGASDLEFTLSLYNATTAISDVVKFAEAVAGYWNEIGVDVKVDAMDPATYLDQVVAHKLGGAVVLGSPGLLISDPEKLSIFFSSTGGYTTVKDEALDDLFAELSATVDRDGQAEIGGEISRYLHEQNYALPIVSLDAVYGVGPKVASFEMMDGNPYAGPFYYLRAK